MKRLCLFALFIAVLCLTATAQPLQLRLLNHWDNPDGTVERGYAGHSIWKWNEIPADKNRPLPRSLRLRYEEYGRTNQAYGINGTVLNNVNAKPMMLSTDMLRKTARIADILRPYGIRVYLSVNFASPKSLGGLPTADPMDASVVEWWRQKVDEIYSLIPDFGGFLVKANSEGEPGPMDYGCSHADGANMLAAALKQHGGIVMWRAFVYSATGGDRANQAYEEFVPLDGKFADNVVLQIKNGPIDFQPLEPVSPLFFAMKHTRLMAELQITQEYTGHSIHTCYLAPMWSDFFKQLEAQNVKLEGVAGVANIGDTPNWTANPLARANWMAFGRLSCNPHASPQQIAEEFLQENFSRDPRFVHPVTQLLMQSHQTLVRYMMPLGLHHIFAAGHHYGPEPWCERRGWREDWLPRYYHRADTIGIGFNRSDHREPCVRDENGSGNSLLYPDPMCSLYNKRETCPEELLLWFHHVPWTYQMKDGRTLWENLCRQYDCGVAEAQAFVRTWQSVRPYIDRKLYEEQLWRFQRQAEDAQWWRDACLQYFQTFARMPLPAGSPAPVFPLKQLMDYRLDIDNYTAPTPQQLPQVPETVRLPRFFSDGMVLQRDRRIPVWGWAKQGTKVTVTLNGKKASAVTDAMGRWKILLPKMKAGGPYELTVNERVIHNVLVGDVYLCSGQSNMELPIRRCMDVVSEMVRDYANDRIRYLKLPHQFNYLQPDSDVYIRPWQNITPENCSEVSALCYFMARELQTETNVPIGIINSAVGGTQVQAWMPQQVLEQFDDYRSEFQHSKHHLAHWTDSVGRQEQRAFHQWEKQMNERDTVLHHWRQEGYDFAAWQPVDIFGDWSGGKNGSYWFHFSVILPDSLAGKTALLRVGAMKDADSTFVNGQYVGNTTYEYPPRKYNVPARLLHAGRNDILVRLMSQSGRPTFTPRKLYQLEVGNQVFPFAHSATMAVGCTMPPRPASTYFVDCPSALYNAMIAPLRDFPVRGIVWYQGESNIDNTHQYADYLAALAASWRRQQGREVPFVIVQLPRYDTPNDPSDQEGWARIRQEQYVASQRIPNAALILLMDTGEDNDIHPQDKHIVGHRVAQQMLRFILKHSSTLR